MPNLLVFSNAVSAILFSLNAGWASFENVAIVFRVLKDSNRNIPPLP